MSEKNYIAFDEKTKATVVELKRNLDFFNAQITLLCQTVLNMNGEDANDSWTLSADLSGLVKENREQSTPLETSRDDYENKPQNN